MSMSDANAFPISGTPIVDEELPSRDRRRDSLFLAASLRVDGGEPVEVRVRNLSEGGLMAEGAPPLSIGTPVVVELRHIGRVPGRIAWYAENRAGVALDVRIDPKKARKSVAARPSGTKYV